MYTTRNIDDLPYCEIYPNTADLIKCHVVCGTQWHDLHLKDALIILHAFLKELDTDAYLELCLHGDIKELLINTIDFNSSLTFTGSDLRVCIKSYLVNRYMPTILKMFEILREQFDSDEKSENHIEDDENYEVPLPPELVFKIRDKIDSENRP